MKIVPVILCGGYGTRLWPISRASNPKQFLDFFGDKTLFQKTIARFINQTTNANQRLEDSNFEDVVIICHEDHRFIVATQLQELNIKSYTIILEPTSKNTASAIAVATNFIQQKYPQSLILAMPADHLIIDGEKFVEQVILAREVAKKDFVVTFGINPKYPETGYGYIQKSQIIDEKNKIFQVSKFIEKPPLNIAQELVKLGDYYWNSGIFLFKTEVILNLLENFAHDIFVNSKKALELASVDFDFIRLDATEFNKSSNISIDYAIMEKAKNIAIMPLNIDWNDVGSWNAIDNLSQKDCHQNAIIGNAITLNTQNCYINSTQQLIATLGVDNLIIVSTKDAVLVANKNNSQDIKYLFEKIKEFNPDYCNNHHKCLRPWGSFEVIDFGKYYKVKKIIVNPFASLSLQRHNHRAEHWVVVEGEAQVQNEERKFILRKNESTFIPLGKKHRLENNSAQILEIIEIQSGDYLEEDDIQRFNDKYGR